MSLRRPTTLTPAKLAAQRSNARRSTGPRTEAGKARSRWNALRHGAWASGAAWTDAALRVPGEDPEEFRKLRQRLLGAPGPTRDPLWQAQIEDLARLYWRHRRLDRAWEILIERERDPEAAALVSISPDGLVLMKQIDATDRAIDRKVRLLMRMREADERRQAADRRAAQSEDADPGFSSLESTAHFPREDLDASGDSPAPRYECPEAAEVAEGNLNLEERSQNVDENKSSVISDK